MAAPALTLHYTLGSNSLDTVAIYTTIHSLSTHPGRTCVCPDTGVTICSASFLRTFWTAAASLLDYFADFYAADTPLMQSVWFHLLDAWQAASLTVLYEQEDLHSRRSSEAQMFEKDYNATLALLQRLIACDERAQHDASEPLIHGPSGTVEGQAGRYTTGPFLSGLKPWQQFLYVGAPGFQAPAGDAEHAMSTPLCRSDELTVQCIPQPAIALVAAHTARARTLCARVHRKGQIDPSDTDTDTDTAAALAAFDARALVFPSTPHTTITSPSPSLSSLIQGSGRKYEYRLVPGAPPILRHEGLGDPSMLVDKPGLLLLDEAVGNCKGREGYVSMTGPLEGEGVGFDVWVVERSGGGYRGQMFEEWVL